MFYLPGILKLFCDSREGHDKLPSSSPFLKAKGTEKVEMLLRNKDAGYHSPKMVEESPLRKRPQEGKMKERKPPQVPWPCFTPGLRHLHGATPPARPSPSQEVKPSRGIVWPGSLLTTQIASPVPALGSREAPGRSADRLGRGLRSQHLLHCPLPNWCRKGKGSLASAWVDSLGVRGVPSADVDGRWPSAPGLCIEGALPGRGASGSGPGLPARAGLSGAALRPQPSGHRQRQHTGPRTEPGLPPDRRGPRPRAGARAAACAPPPYLRGPRRTR